MSLFNRNSGDPGPLEFLIALLLYPFVQPLRYFRKRVYTRGFGGMFLVLAGSIVAFWLGVLHFGSWLHHDLGYGWFWTTVDATIATWFIFAAIFPAAWLWGFYQAFRLGDAINDGFRTVAKKYVRSAFKSIVTTLTAGPIGKRLWKPILEDGATRAFINKLVIGAAYLTAVAIGMYSGYLTYGWAHGHVVALIGALPIALPMAYLIGWFFAGMAAIAVGFVAVSLGVQLIDNGDLPFVSVAAGTAATLPVYAKLVAILGSNLFAGLATVIFFVLFVADLFPLVLRMFGNGFWKKVWDKIEPLADKAYSGSDANKNFNAFLHHVLSAVSAALIVWGTVTMCGIIGFGLYSTLALSAVAAWAGYGLTFKATDHDGGNFMFGCAMAAPVGWMAAKLYLATGWVYGLWLGSALGVVSAALIVWLVIPVLYFLVLSLATFIGKPGIEGPVSVAFNRFNTAYGNAQKRMSKLAKRVYDNYPADGEKDQSGYREQFLHAANLVVTFGVWWVVANFASVVTTSSVLHLVAAIGLPYLSYTLVGKTMLDTKYGVGFVSFVLALLAAAFAGIAVWTLGPALELKVAAAFASTFVFGASMLMVFPVAFAALRFATESWTIQWFGPALAFVFRQLFRPMGWLYDGVVAALSRLAKLLRPVWERIAVALSGIKRAYDRILQALRGRA